MDTRARVVAEAMRLFGEQGYARTTVAEIERAAGLSPGSGSLYRHFRSKEELLAEGVRAKVAENAGLLAMIGDPQAMAALPLRERLAGLARAGLRRLEQERDLNRMVVRDLAAFPALLDEVREGEMRRIHAAVAQWLRMQAGAGDAAERDWEALAVVLVGSVSHFWLLRDVFGTHPSGLDEDRWVTAFVDLAERLLQQPPRT
ncbi:TetR/AcrR family transcriptional regulator [Streptomyces sp. NRRL F-5123]|uniref:TetR/AcrR family transcriptional regulator n=1 Tax=Streptomyces sp. NRRL F-5123 TaxID=1463856 RepID=UPI0005BB5C4A|nr:TetR/AcrR family transcriptional regulator [Streptomyces sp. NRRL F-5123]